MRYLLNWLTGSRHAFKQCAQTACSHTSAQPSRHVPGLFGIAGLRQPSDFFSLAYETKQRSEEILLKISQSQANATVVQLFDDLSDQVWFTFLRLRMAACINTCPIPKHYIDVSLPQIAFRPILMPCSTALPGVRCRRVLP